MQQRESRVKPEYAKQYPGVDPNHWYPAAVLADYVRRPYQRARRKYRPARDLPDAHFAFRGGAPRGTSWDASRRADAHRPR